jgi:hypothetical protein
LNKKKEQQISGTMGFVIREEKAILKRTRRKGRGNIIQELVSKAELFFFSNERKECLKAFFFFLIFR